MPAPRIIRLKTSRPAEATLAVMGKNARASANTWTMREWAARLATKAKPRDYVGQLREVYNGIVKRWRYVQEPGEWVHGKPETLLGYTLGANYNRGPRCPNPLHCDVEGTKWREHGWGDCDDVAQLAGAAALAIGMPEVRWRVARWGNGAHVSAIVRTPTGEWVSVDPVGHPKHAFGWALDPPGGSVRFFDMHGRPTRPPRGKAGIAMPTYMSGPEGQESQLRTSPHVVLTVPGDTRGARTLGVPLWHHRIMRRGAVLDGTPAVDQYGEQYEYSAPSDAWVPLSGWFKKFRRRRKKRWARIRRKVRRVFKKTRAGRALLRAGKKIRKGVAKVAKWVGKSRIFKLLRKAKAKILGSKFVQRLASRALSVFGIPAAATRAVLAREAKIAKMGGRAKLVELLASGKRKQAARFMMKSLKAAGKAAIPGGGLLKRARKMFRGPDDADVGTEWVMGQDGGYYTVAPVEQFAGYREVLDLGQTEAQSTVEPGTFHKIQSGENLLAVGQALNNGRRTGGPFGSRLNAAKLINASAYNQRFMRPTKAGFERNMFGARIISFAPRAEWDGLAAIWIPPAVGIEPPEQCPGGSSWDPTSRQCVMLPIPEAPDPDPEPPIEIPPEPEPGPIIPAPAPEPQPVPPPSPPIQPTLCKSGFVRNAAGVCARPCPPGTVVSPRADPYDPAPACVPGAAPPTEPDPGPTVPWGVPPGLPPVDCPPGSIFNVATGECQEVGTHPGIPDPGIPDPEPMPPPVGPTQPAPPSPGGGGPAFPWIPVLLAMVGAG